MPNLAKFVGTLTIGAVLTGGMAGLELATTATSAQAAAVVIKGGGGDYDRLFRNRSYNRNRSLARNWTRHWNGAAARSWARNWARHMTRSGALTRAVNRQAQTVNISLVFPETFTSPVTATASIPITR
ncbi:hypothetical protein GCM10009677_06060 [Sphaerisporangium rubeum]|uniref:Uncharacterized protein n=1 Tax=Sphaerisporangium rubeum TaxID=321317 RepID=A0A7X0IKP7_9ACTN|nr:hypothetical protein [Sphaerisporangium rubeum]MBB6476962.1 hypothetical protein [Sphaerisporangium rubeum]